MALAYVETHTTHTVNTLIQAFKDVGDRVSVAEPDYVERCVCLKRLSDRAAESDKPLLQTLQASLEEQFSSLHVEVKELSDIRAQLLAEKKDIHAAMKLLLETYMKVSNVLISKAPDDKDSNDETDKTNDVVLVGVGKEVYENRNYNLQLRPDPSLHVSISAEPVIFNTSNVHAYNELSTWGI